MNSKVEEVIFCGESLERIIILTENGKAYHTKNFGRNWTLTSNTFDSYHSSMNMEVLTLLQNPSKTDQVIFVDKNLENMITNDCGDTFKPLYDRQKLKDVTFHPFDENLLLGISNQDDLMVSKDGGETWSQI